MRLTDKGVIALSVLSAFIAAVLGATFINWS